MFSRGISVIGSGRSLYGTSSAYFLNLSADAIGVVVAASLAVLVTAAAIGLALFRPSPRHKFIVELLEQLSASGVEGPEVEKSPFRRGAA